MIEVATYMMERAFDYGLNSAQMYVLGLLHDVGYLEGAKNHEEHGAEILTPILQDTNFLYAIANHGRKLQEIEKETGGMGIFPEFILLVEADMSVDANGNRVKFYERLNDIRKRHGCDSDAAKNSKANMEYVQKYCEKHQICPAKGFFRFSPDISLT